MAAPEWHGENPTGASDAPAILVPAKPQATFVPAGAAGGRDGAASVVAAAGVLVGLCGGFFDPMVLAQLDAALAHQLAATARERSAEASGLVERGVRESRSVAYLDQQARHASACRAAATRAGQLAGAATEVVTAFGGRATGAGFDQGVVDQVYGAALVDVVARLEEAKNALTAVQVQAETLFAAQQRLAQARAGLPKAKLGMGVALQIGLARHESAHRGRQHTELAAVLVRELPHTMNAITAGVIGEDRARIVATETVFLSAGHRAEIDALISADHDKLAAMGSRELAAAARNAAYRLEPEVFTKRREKAVTDRHVSLRPAAYGMTLLSALIPLKQGVAIYNTLTQVVDTAKAGGDPRGKGQLMADALIHRLTRHAPCDQGAGTVGDHRGPAPKDPNPAGAGQAATHQAGGLGPVGSPGAGLGPVGSPGAGLGPVGSPEAGSDSQTGGPGLDRDAGTGGFGQPGWAAPPPRGAGLCTTVTEPSIMLELVMTDRALFDGANDPAILVGHEPIPAPEARTLVLGPETASPDTSAGTNTGTNSGASDPADPADPIGPEGPAGSTGRFSPQVWLKRLFTHPDSGALLAMDSRARLFPAGLKEFLRLQYQRCATPYCDAPIRQYDHIKSWAAGGATTTTNGQGLCTACNQDKEAPGWKSEPANGTNPGEALPQTTITTPTGHRYITTAPPLPGPTRHQRPRRNQTRRC
ncbi:hypothetical protein CVV68_05015 [Arthrobacter livingstonensis]|uniref:HNH nuclease domain-containing protein n=1 Tax=Arthrobacter livingstonensis TaxID=670078 RepID=A0A2V5LBD5_9MICC|nr:HNH endonuclease [Arthrobacter livingstonensis]PYI68668.1 hypothetical protein CVV68_05015 [Arthrobacter livingstonensis]